MHFPASLPQVLNAGPLDQPSAEHYEHAYLFFISLLKKICFIMKNMGSWIHGFMDLLLELLLVLLLLLLLYVFITQL